LAKTLNVSVEYLLTEAMEYRPTFEIFKSNVCHRVKDKGDIDFITDVIKSDMILSYLDKRWYREALYMLAMVDYLSRENDIPLVSDYNDIRSSKLESPVYPSGVLVRSIFSGNELAKEESIKNAIPEFLRHNIIEAEVRDVC
jgi:hypothetical protein